MIDTRNLDSFLDISVSFSDVSLKKWVRYLSKISSPFKKPRRTGTSLPEGVARSTPVKCCHLHFYEEERQKPILILAGGFRVWRLPFAAIIHCGKAGFIHNKIVDILVLVE
ncbi:uncharacterized protein LOC125502015 [Athalia rosae]|uniref:uncharacterized protein LOC125502015 n=1 Tax=Athalia rosae TaxID=37344 RepID=UPI002033A43B|nr:uncharacterized protein LOC125502015 [Athalia rosae]